MHMAFFGLNVGVSGSVSKLATSPKRKQKTALLEGLHLHGKNCPIQTNKSMRACIKTNKSLLLPLPFTPCQ